MPLDRTYNCHFGQSYSDVALNTYGTMDEYVQLLNDNGLEPNDIPLTGIQVLWDDTLVINQTTQTLNLQNNVIFATLMGYGVPEQTNPIIQTYPDFYNTSYTATTGNIQVIALQELQNAQLIQVTKEIKTLVQGQYNFNSLTGTITLAGNLSMAEGETLFVLYQTTVTTQPTAGQQVSFQQAATQRAAAQQVAAQQLAVLQAARQNLQQLINLRQ